MLFIIVESFKVHAKVRQQGQSVAALVAELRRLTEHCAIGTSLEDVIRDRLVSSITDDQIQRRIQRPILKTEDLLAVLGGGQKFTKLDMSQAYQQLPLSRSLSTAQWGYSQLEKEALAIMFGLKKFHQYLFGKHCTIVTDHKPLLGENKGIPQQAAARMQRWVLTQPMNTLWSTRRA